jgi:hypothetical protein
VVTPHTSLKMWWLRSLNSVLEIGLTLSQEPLRILRFMQPWELKCSLLLFSLQALLLIYKTFSSQLSFLLETISFAGVKFLISECHFTVPWEDKKLKSRNWKQRRKSKLNNLYKPVDLHIFFKTLWTISFELQSFSIWPRIHKPNFPISVSR